MKVFLDTSAILNGALHNLDTDYEVVISSMTVAELEKIKTSYNKSDEIKYLARQAVRDILGNNYEFYHSNSKEQDKLLKKYPTLFDIPDHRIICDAIAYAKGKTKPTTFFTSDGAQFLAAKSVEYTNLILPYFLEPTERKQDSMEYKGWREVALNDDDLALLYSKPTENFLGCKTNEFVKVIDSSNEVKDLLIWNGAKYKHLSYDSLKTKEFGTVAPRNTEQKMLFHLLQDRNIPVKLTLSNWGGGKAIVNSAIIPTPNGMKRVDEIQVGDYLFDRQGQPTKVLGVFPQGELDVYKVSFYDGREVYCNNEHLWAVLTKTHGKIHEQVLSTQQMLDRGIKNSNGSNKFAISNTKCVQYHKKNFDIDPYVIGCFIGDGCCTEQRLTISSNDEELVSEISSLIGAKRYEKLYTYSWNFFDETGKRFSTKKFFQNYPSLIDYAKNKHIPEEYFYGDEEQRLSLLQGLMDTDGSIDGQRNKRRVSFCSTSINLIHDVQRLVYSLGWGCSKNPSIDKRYLNPNSQYKNPCYQINLMIPRKDRWKVFRLSRKKKLALDYEETKFEHNKTLRITNIEKMNYKENMTCFYVDNEEHMFLANDFIPTHNTMLMLSHACYLMQKGLFDKIIFVRNNIIAKDTKDIGFLAGSMEEKMLPWMAPLKDHLGDYMFEQYLEEGKLEVVPLSFMRGRDLSAPPVIVFVDECENLTKQHVQLLLGRVGGNSEIWFAGDLRQTDHLTFEKNSGVIKMIEGLTGNELFGYVKLIKSERGRISALANELDF